MVISKYVPLQISRKRFSDFLQCEKLEDSQYMYLVGYEDKDGVKKNKKLKFSDVKSYIDAVDEKIGSSTGALKDELEIQIVKLWKQVNNLKGVEDDDLPEQPQMNSTVFRRAIYNEDDKCSVINLKNTLGCVEINGGGTYTQDFLIFDNPIIGTVTRVIIDNSGRTNDEGVFEPPTTNFVFNYGRNDYDDYGNPLWNTIVEVEPYYTGIVEILHTNRTDVIINVNHTPTMFVTDVQVASQYVDDDVDFKDVSPETNERQFYDIDMENDRAYLQFDCSDNHSTYTFWFKNPELGSMTYMVISNPTEEDKTIVYGKVIVNQDGGETYNTQIIIDRLHPNERTIVEIFHSLSSDIIAKVTTVNM